MNRRGNANKKLIVFILGPVCLAVIIFMLQFEIRHLLGKKRIPGYSTASKILTKDKAVLSAMGVKKVKTAPTLKALGFFSKNRRPSYLHEVEVRSGIRSGTATVMVGTLVEKEPLGYNLSFKFGGKQYDAAGSYEE